MFRAILRVFDYSGRSTRSEYWSFWAGLIIVCLLTGIGFAATTDANMSDPASSASLGDALAVVLLLSAVLLIPLKIRRFHDFGWSGWCLFIVFVPVANIVIELMLLFRGSLPDIFQYAAPSEPQQINIYNSPSATAADTIHSQTLFIGQLEKLADLREKGVLTADEFAVAKANLLPKS